MAAGQDDIVRGQPDRFQGLSPFAARPQRDGRFSGRVEEPGIVVEALEVGMHFDGAVDYLDPGGSGRVGQRRAGVEEPGTGGLGGGHGQDRLTSDDSLLHFLQDERGVLRI
jgi:hypothetical protein